MRVQDVILSAMARRFGLKSWYPGWESNPHGLAA